MFGPYRELLGRESQHIVRAHRDGVDRYVAVHHGDPGCAPQRMAVRALENCRSGRVRWDQGPGVLVAELLFDTRLRSGDTFLFRYGFDDGTAGVCTEDYIRGFRSTGGQYALQVRFDERALPLRCHRFSQHSAAAPRRARRPSLSGLHRSITSSNHGYGRGSWGSAGTRDDRPGGTGPAPRWPTSRCPPLRHFPAESPEKGPSS